MLWRVCTICFGKVMHCVILFFTGYCKKSANIWLDEKRIGTWRDKQAGKHGDTQTIHAQQINMLVKIECSSTNGYFQEQEQEQEIELSTYYSSHNLVWIMLASYIH